jgi:hypothetical protein
MNYFRNDKTLDCFVVTLLAMTEKRHCHIPCNNRAEIIKEDKEREK